MVQLRLSALLFALPFLCSSQEALSRDRVIRDLKEFQREFGLRPTGNFLRESPALKAHYRCYYTGKLTLPDSYDGLELRQTDEAGCNLDETKYDVFFYPIEAVASGSAPVTSSLNEATAERLAVVVSHEDFHHELEDLPPSVAEAATTLIGFLTAAEFARTTYGESSELYQNLAAEAGIFAAKAKVVNEHHRRLSRLYAAARSGIIDRAAALADKDRSFAELHRACAAIDPEPRSFNRCPAVFNNAGLAFDMSYTKHYPLMHDLFLAHNRDLKATVRALRQFAARTHASEEELVRALRQVTTKLQKFP